MINDILTVMWKERKGIFRQRGSRTRALLTMLVPVAMVAVYFPWQMGLGWVETYWSLVACVIVPMLTVGITVPDAIAGEREHHTLATLLASRLSDRAILFGKFGLAVTYGWVSTVVVLILALVTLHIAHWDGEIMFYQPSIFLTDLLFGFLISTLVTGLGVLFSLRSATVQEAQQMLMAVVMFPPLVLGVLGTFLLGQVAGLRQTVGDVVSAIGGTQLVLIVAGVLLLLSLLLLATAMARFRRSRLTMS